MMTTSVILADYGVPNSPMAEYIIIYYIMSLKQKRDRTGSITLSRQEKDALDAKVRLAVCSECHSVQY